MAWLKLLRISALPSALSNILIGYLLANQTWTPIASLLWLLLSSACLYCAGMVLNDVFDVEIDQKQRSNRPIASGAISLKSARFAGLLLLAIGVLAALPVSSTSFVVAATLALAVYLYDGPLKRTIAAPVVMGTCRSLNIVLGASSSAALPMTVVLYAIAIGIFVAGITWLAKHEAVESQTASTLIPGSGLMAIGMILIGVASSGLVSVIDADSSMEKVIPWAIGFLCLPILRRLAVALATASAGAVQSTVILSLRTLIIFDACMCMLVPFGRPYCSVVLLGLLAISWLLGRVVKMT